MHQAGFRQGGRPLSPAVRAGDFIFISGQTTVGPTGENVGGTIAVQTRQVLDNVKAALRLGRGRDG